MTDSRHVEYLPLDEIIPAPHNPKRHATDGLISSIARFGYATPALRDERTGRLVVGHGRTEAVRRMRDAGDQPPSGVQVDDAGRWLVPVVCGWASRSDAEADAYLVADNRHTELGGWDHQELADLLADVQAYDPDLVDIAGWDLADLEELLAEDVAELPPALADPDHVPDPPREPVSKPGDLWKLGPHRLLCGDSTNPEHIDTLLADLGPPGIVYTDPPYGISIVNASGKIGHATQSPSGLAPTTKYLPVAGDGSAQVAADAFALSVAAWPTARQVWWGGNHYAGTAALPDASCWLVWDKENGEISFADVELAWTNAGGGARLLRHMWHGMIRASERGAGKRVHPTQKPVALAEWAFEQVDPDKTRKVVLDLFGGSGSTLIAAHQTGRVAALCEMEPHYVDIIVKRWVEATGQDARRDDGRSWSELAA